MSPHEADVSTRLMLTLTGWCSATRPLAVLEGSGMIDWDHVAVCETSLADGRHPAILLIHILIGIPHSHTDTISHILRLGALGHNSNTHIKVGGPGTQQQHTY